MTVCPAAADRRITTNVTAGLAQRLSRHSPVVRSNIRSLLGRGDRLAGPGLAFFEIGACGEELV
ncbi:MAG: hypothetical protein ABSE77_21625, partial [Acidimicrobiales bacterium]